MSETGEQGMQQQDPADQAGIGGGVVPDDQAEGYEQAAELVNDPQDDEPAEHPADG